MQRQLLNLALLRGDTVSSEAPTAIDAPNERERAGANVSRRRLIGIGGIAALGMTPLMRVLGATIRPEFDVTATRRRVAFRVDGRERWVVDADRFGPGAEIAFDQGDDRMTLALKNARYPGTDVVADLTCAITRGVSGWMIAIDMAMLLLTR